MSANLLEPMEPMCEECIVFFLAKTEAMCQNCQHVNCGWKCEFSGKRIKPEQPYCENWDCGNLIRCRKALNLGIDVGREMQMQIDAKVEEHHELRKVVLCKDCLRSKQDRDVGLYCNLYRQYRNSDDYCSYGERSGSGE